MRWVYPRDGSEPYEVTEATDVHRMYISPDSIYDIGDPRFNSRATHAEYMKRNGLQVVEAVPMQCKPNHVPDPSLKSDVIRAYEMVRSGYRPQRRQEEL